MKSGVKRAATIASLAILVILAIKGLVIVGQFIGYASFAGEAGTISELVLQQKFPTQFWAAVYGVAVRVPGYTNQQWEDFTAGSMEEKNLLFDCMERKIDHEVYASLKDPSTLNLSSLYAATPAEVDAYFGKNASDYDSAANTYTQSVSFNYGTTTVSTLGTTTYKYGEDPPTTFRVAIAKTGDGDLVFIALVTNFTEGFNERVYNYQLILPAPANQTKRYYFFTDPNDVCPEGEGEELNNGVVYGTVTSTTGLPIEEVIVEVAGVTNLTNASGGYRIRTDEGFHNIYAIKTGYKVYKNNVTVVAGNQTRHDIILEEEKVPNENTGIGPGIDQPGDDVGPAQQEGVGPGQDVGPGEAPLVPLVQQPKIIEGKDYLVSLLELNRKLRLGQFLQERIFVYSFKKKTAFVTLSINGSEIAKLISVDKTEMNVEPKGKGEFVLTIFGVGETGVFNGSINLDGDINATIPVTIEVLPREQLPIEALHLETETAEKSYYPDEVVRIKTDLRNMLSDRQYPVRLFFTVQNPEGTETLWTAETNVFLKTAFSLINSFRLPDDTLPGDYVVRVTANYLGLSSGTSTIFNVAVPFWKRSFLGLSYLSWFLILLALAAIIAGVWYVRKRIEEKKKYHLKVDYDELPKPGPRSVYVGKIAETNNKTYFNLENFKTHTIVAGSTGGGKSVSAQVIVEEALDKGVAVIVFDPTAQWTGMLRPCKDKMMLSLYSFFDMKKSDAKAFNGNIRSITNPREKIDIRKYLKPGEIQVFAANKLDPKDMDVLVANAIREVFHANFEEQKALRVLFVFDEVHRLLPKFGGSGDGFLQIERACREFRKWGLGVMLISQVLSDFVGTIKANINTEIQMRTRDEGDLERIRQKYGEDVLRSLVKATVGTGMVENPAYNRGKPYFVAFRPLKHSVERLSDEEIDRYNEYNNIIDDLSYSLDQLEQEGVDVFDLRLELKLALDKVKTGSFNMVKIYLDGLKPRIEKEWAKLGKQPKHLVRELVEMSEIKAELARAKEERDKYVAAQQAEGPAEEKEKKEWGWKDDVPPEKMLNLKNGMIVINLASLYDEIAAMKDADLVKEFDPEPSEEGKAPVNRFAEWVLEAIGDERLAYNLAKAKTKEELLAILEKKKNGEELPDVKPPEWLAFEELASEAPSATPQGVASPAPALATGGGASAAAPPQTPKSSLGAPAGAPAAPPAPGAPQARSPPSAPPSSQASPPSSPAAPPSQSQARGAPPSAPPAEPSQPSAPATPARGSGVGGDQPAPGGESEWVKSPPGEAGGSGAGGPGGSGATSLPSGSSGAILEGRGGEGSSSSRSSPAKASSIDELVVRDEREAFRLDDGRLLRSVKELREYVAAMSEEEFRRHVTPEYNHFAEWINGVFHDEALASRVARARTRAELAAALH